MINYELAKQLKDAGFPQDRGRFACADDTQPHFPGEKHEGEKCDKCFRLPTLSELIEACGERFALHKNKDHWCAWQINSNPRDREAFDYQTRGSTPEEAVARLWLELNKK